MDVYKKLNDLGVELPPVPAKGGVYSTSKYFGENLIYISGCGPIIDIPIAGRVGKEFTLEEGQQYARQAILNVLAILEEEIGDLNKVTNAVKILFFVNSDNDFFEQPSIANGCTQLLLDVFGEKGLPSRSAIGVNVLPGNIPVEIEAIFEIQI